MNYNLYEITGDVLQLQEMLVSDPDNEAIQDTLEALEGELSMKAEAYCKVIRNMEGNLESVKSEIDRLSKKKKNLENSVSRLKEALFNAMQVTGTDKIKGDLFTLRIQNNAPQLPKDLDVNQVPIDYLIEREYDVDRRKLLAKEMAEKKLNLFQKLQKARVELQDMNLKKSGQNKFAGFSYYELSDFLPAINIICNNVGLFTAISFDIDYAILRIYDCEDMDKFVEFKSPMKEIQQKGCNDIQSLGSVETYSR